MADSKITKKPHPSGSLARRILSIAILLLVIPLFLQSLFLYRQEYRERVSDTQAQLEMLAKERSYWIGQRIENTWLLLDVISPTNPNVKRLYMQKISVAPAVADRFVWICPNRGELLVGKKVSPASALVIPIPIAEVTRDLGMEGVQLTLLDSKAKKASTPTSLQVEEPIPKTHLTLQLSMDTERLSQLHFQSYIYRFAILLFFVGVLGGGAVYLFTRRMAKPLRNLCRTMDRVSEGAAHARYTPDKMGFEINALGIQFNQTLDSLLHHIQETEKERLAREKLAEEWRIGHEIQASLFPSYVPGLPGVDIAAGYWAAREVNGDFYDLFRLDDGRLLLAICDTAGKGISACLFSLGLRSILRSLANQTPRLSELVRRANDLYLRDAHPVSMFSTLWIGIYDPTTHQLTYCSQGHPPALLRHKNHLYELGTEGIALGAQRIDVVSTQEKILEKGDRLILYTDGILEAHDSNQQLFGKQRLKEVILRKPETTSQQLIDRIVEEVGLFSQGVPQHDDMTLVVFHSLD